MTDIQTRRATQEAFHGADNAWWNALVAQFGRKAGDVRYTPAGAGEPGSALRRIYSDRFRAYEAWAVAHGMTAQPDPLVEPIQAHFAPVYNDAGTGGYDIVSGETGKGPDGARVWFSSLHFAEKACAALNAGKPCPTMADMCEPAPAMVPQQVQQAQARDGRGDAAEAERRARLEAEGFRFHYIAGLWHYDGAMWADSHGFPSLSDCMDDAALTLAGAQDDDDGCPVGDPDCMGRDGDCHDACEAPAAEAAERNAALQASAAAIAAESRAYQAKGGGLGPWAARSPAPSDPVAAAAPAMLAALEEIAAYPKQGEPCPDDPAYRQDWTDSGVSVPLAALHEIIDRARAAIATAKGCP